MGFFDRFKKRDDSYKREKVIGGYHKYFKRYSLKKL